ncbi:uncharacterized protein MONBRDRAFT_10258 [Monosiga brevicollis MX1]|uniref:Uncharacterized protein n=1 Tax=Monosiga brevicollis TaxID=81824 RepID=A9V5P3_MONBE|nr:uncharacterized protein MONBRDRAFT_10258 [Monosiga brevicollis MX1]EDQ87076.1 predicted protein [Monosiga brevicollis MX1]|eukprot:XP_001748019.1 hypothetical protein [Monosiga brevicollis MX1]
MYSRGFEDWHASSRRENGDAGASVIALADLARIRVWTRRDPSYRSESGSDACSVRSNSISDLAISVDDDAALREARLSLSESQEQAIILTTTQTVNEHRPRPRALSINRKSPPPHPTFLSRRSSLRNRRPSLPSAPPCHVQRRSIRVLPALPNISAF